MLVFRLAVTRLNPVFFKFNPLFVTICSKTFSNLCVSSVGDMWEILPLKFSLLFSVTRSDVVSGECC